MTAERMKNSPKTKRLFSNVSVMLLSLLISLLVGEITLRVFSAKTDSIATHHDLCCQYDPLLGWKKKPNAKVKHVTGEYNITEYFNSKGLRGPEYSYNKNNNEYRILILGDSFAEGYTVEFEELFSEVLKRILNKNPGNAYYETINSGTGGYSTDQELIFIQKEGINYNPDLTLLMFHDNDVWYNNQSKYWRGHKPIFTLQNGELFLTDASAHSPQSSNASKEIRYVSREKRLHRIKTWLGKKSHLYRLTSERIKNIYFLSRLLIKLGLQDNPLEGEFGIYAKTYNANIRKAWKITEAILIKLKIETASVGSKLLVFYIPSSAGVYPEIWQATRKKYRISDKNWDVEQPRVELEAICNRNNIDFISPIELLKATAHKLKIKGKRLYFARDNHWNAIGHKTAGEILAKYINSHYLTKDKQ